MVKYTNPRVAILVSTAFSWGRSIVNGILSYSSNVEPWHIWIRPSLQPNQIEKLPINWNCDGIIAHVTTPQLASILQESGLPVVNVSDSPIEGFSAPCVRTNDRAGTRLAAEYFISRGFRNMAFVGSGMSENPVRYGQAFKEALSEHRLKCSAFPVNKKMPNDHAALIPWLKSLPKPVGILVWGVGNGHAVVDSCREAGLRVPHDVAVLCGNYDEVMNRTCVPALSGIRLPTEQIGFKAAGLLQEMMQGGSIPHGITEIDPHDIHELGSSDSLAVDDPMLIKAIQFIREHAFDTITMKDILKVVPMSQRAFERHFIKTFGHSPVDEIRQLRINKARKLLVETDMQMQFIAEACGYATYNYLTAVFKKKTGMTPRDYRNKYRT